MFSIILPIVFILAALLVFLKFRSSKSEETSASKTGNEDGKQGDKKSTEEVVIPLEELVLPSNFPSELVLYFGSQTGTAEKFCVTLEEEANKLGINSVKVMDFENFNEE
jgi:sulfite reductase alpha subunit-like flavoprotein